MKSEWLTLGPPDVLGRSLLNSQVSTSQSNPLECAAFHFVWARSSEGSLYSVSEVECLLGHRLRGKPWNVNNFQNLPPSLSFKTIPLILEIRASSRSEEILTAFKSDYRYY